MIDDFRALAVFVAVADSNSFSHAGRRLKLSTSVVSHHVSRLEEKLGVPLFYRSTRSMSLTPEGKRMVDSARRMVAAGEEALETLADANDQLKGEIRMTMPAFGDDTPLHQRVWTFVKKYPQVSVSVFKSDIALDLVKEGFDLAIRLGKLTDQKLMSRRIGDFHRTLVAAPDYLAQHPPIRTPDDLLTCEFISFSMLPDGFTLLKGEKQVEIEPVHKRVEANSIHSVKSAIMAGLGIQRLAASEVEDQL
ncbi:MAG: LysR family transcriptional regulator, partial [Pseudomonadota bacterium]